MTEENTEEPAPSTAAENDAMADVTADSQAGGSEGQTANGDPTDSPAVEKDPDDWVTGDEPMTAPQASYLKTLSQEAGESFDPNLNKAEASRRIDELQSKSGRGRGQD